MSDSPTSARALTATRFSTLLGLWLVMLLSLPRYWLLGDQTRLVLLGAFVVAVSVALAAVWRLMSAAERGRCPRAIRHLLICLVVALVVVAAWHLLSGTGVVWAMTLSQGMALGLVLHVVLRLWRRR
ncbi:hypothetical protein EVC62_16605 [Salinicola endophyticus]|uniref:Transmembrane protein n=1 Tax=Salinicola endophyticus TaxID=1949083 RepID=A0ABY8FMS4_9GAMM|nr:hypothetical protein [Salinicola endophyticus]WFF42983.1 hypothetical protein EVC62_16605 [Salinicola endophyticus]